MRRSRFGAPGTVIGVMAKFRDLFRNALLQDKNVSNHILYPSQSKRPVISKELEGLLPAATNELPIHFYAPGFKDIYRAMSLQEDLGFNMVLVGTKHIDPVIKTIAEKRIPLMLSLKLPPEVKADTSKTEKNALFDRKLEAYQQYISQASKLEKANVNFAFSLMSADVRETKKVLLTMIKAGLSEDRALSALTTNAARILNIENSAGSIERGKMANLMICDTSYFNKGSFIQYMVVDGDVFEYSTKKKITVPSINSELNFVGDWSYNTVDLDDTGVFKIVKKDDKYEIEIVSNSADTKMFARDIKTNGSNLNFIIDFIQGGETIPIKVNLEMSQKLFTGNLDLGENGVFQITGSIINP